MALVQVPPTAAGAWTEIASANLPTNASTITISGIPTTYKFLRLYINNHRTAGTGIFRFELNADGSSLYQVISTYPNISSVAQDGNISPGTQVQANTLNSAIVFDLNNYADTTAHKQFFIQTYSQQTSTNFDSRLLVGSYRSTNAVTSIRFFDANANNFAGGAYKLWGAN